MLDTTSARHDLAVLRMEIAAVVFDTDRLREVGRRLSRLGSVIATAYEVELLALIEAAAA